MTVSWYFGVYLHYILLFSHYSSIVVIIDNSFLFIMNAKTTVHDDSVYILILMSYMGPPVILNRL